MALSARATELIQSVKGKLHRHYGRELGNATKEQIFRALGYTLRDMMSGQLVKIRDKKDQADREVHYLSLEFLMGRSLQKNAFNLGLQEDITQALDAMGFDAADIFETEPDASLGNGGLGRLAACYLDSMTTLGIPATGYSICYQFGMFKQKIIDNQQVELPDPWMEIGDVWLITNLDQAKRVRFGGCLTEKWDDGRLEYEHTGYTEVLAVPMDMPVAGFGGKYINTLRLWDAKSPTAIDMDLFARGEHMKAMEQNAMAEVIAKVLYPEDNHFEGKLLRMRQQYFFVSATVQDIVAKHCQRYGRLDNFHLKHVIHINDTHPTLVIPELMRIFVDEHKMEWDQAWQIVTRSVAYTNHTVMPEALERWPQQIIEMLMPRIWQILVEINDRYVKMLYNMLGNEMNISEMAVIWDGQARMANLDVYACYAVNGVSELHSRILRKNIFKDQFAMWPDKFFNVTNGVDHRRWLSQINPRLHGLITELNGNSNYMARPNDLQNLEKYADDKAALEKLAKVKRLNKEDFSQYLAKTQGIIADPSSIFDFQVKRLHEYKRQLLNVIHIIHLYHMLKDNPNMDFVPRTFIFGAKAASGYYSAKRIIRLIHSVSNHIASDPAVCDRLKVIFLENYRVSLAERIMPASEVSEQISVAGKEASGTGNMKFMFNGAVTVGTLDGANVEIYESVGDDNIFLFGLHTDEVERIQAEGYDPVSIYSKNPALKRVLDHMSDGFSDGVSYSDVTSSLLIGNNGHPDTYMTLADFDSYCGIQKIVEKTYLDPAVWNRMSLMNIAGAGRFAADRSISQYARYIWNVPTAMPKK